MSENRTQAEHKVVLVTGFGPFIKDHEKETYEENPSWQAVKRLPSMGLKANGQDVIVEAREIRVSYKHVREKVPALWEELRPDLCIHVGLSPSASTINYEKRASNHEYAKEDVDSQLPESPPDPSRLSAFP